ncbi:hypothetical protein AVL60_01195 [Kocuria palustris]|nr:hypothetical protein AVL60_01195 [Kocuria palustris]
MHELGRLIASVQERNGWSDRDLQLRAEELELTALSKSNFSRWRNSPVNSIKGSNIRDMAAVLGVAEATVATAALESMGIRAGGDAGTSVDTALSLDPDLSARDKTLVRALLGAMSGAEERGGHGEAAPMNTAGGDLADEQQDPHAASAVGDEMPEVERGADAPGPAANAERIERAASAWTGKVAQPGGAGSRTPVSAGRAGRSESEEGAEPGEQPSADFFYGLAAHDRRTEGMAQRDAIDAAGEESQVDPDDEDGQA